MEHIAEFAASDHVLGLLHQGIIAVIEINRIDHSGLGSKFHQFFRFGGGHRQRLFRDDMLAGANDLFADLEVQMVGGAIVDDLDFLVGQKILNTAVGYWNVQFISLGPRQFIIRLAKGDHLDEAESSSSLHMCGADETGSDNSCFDSFHSSFIVQTLPSSK